MISGSAASARARPTRCCMPPDSSSRIALPSNRRGRPLSSAASAVSIALVLVEPSAPRGRRRRSRAPCGAGEARRSGTPCRYSGPASRAARSAFMAGDVLAFDDDLAEARLDQTVEEADQRRLAAARQAHDAEDLARGGPEAGIGDADDAVELLQHLVLDSPRSAMAWIAAADVLAEDLPDRPAVDQHFVGISSRVFMSLPAEPSLDAGALSGDSEAARRLDADGPAFEQLVALDVFPALQKVGMALDPIGDGLVHGLAFVDRAVDRGDVGERDVDAGDDLAGMRDSPPRSPSGRSSSSSAAAGRRPWGPSGT